MSLQGTLSTLGITELMEFLAQREASGQVDITTVAGTASYLFANGKVSLAEFDFARGAGEDAAEATYYVLAESDGNFYYAPQEVDGAPEGVAVDIVLKESAEIADKWAKVEEKIPSTNHIIERNSHIDSSVTIEPEWWQFLSLIGSGRSTAEFATELDMSVLEASSTVFDMVEAGLVVVSDEEPAVTPAPDVADVAAVATEVEPEPAAVDDEVHNISAPETLSPVDETPVPDEIPASEEVLASEELPSFEQDLSSDFGSADYESSEVEKSDFSELPAESFEGAEVTEGEIAAAPAPPIMADLETEVPETEIAPPVEEMTEDVEEAVVETSEPAPVLETPAASVPSDENDDGWSRNPFLDDRFATTVPATPVVEEIAAEPFIETVTEEPVIDDLSPVDNIEPLAVANPIDDFNNADPFAAPADVASAPEVDQGEASELYGLDSSFNGKAPEGSSVADEVIGDLAFLNSDLDEQMPIADAPSEIAPPAQASPMPEPETASSVPSIGEVDPFGALSDLVVDEEEPEDRGSVLKFLRRD